MDREIFYVDALIPGLGWICVNYTYHQREVEFLEAYARDASASTFPGQAPRPTRIRRKSAGQVAVIKERRRPTNA
jgi:hypothetical protein